MSDRYPDAMASSRRLRLTRLIEIVLITVTLMLGVASCTSETTTSCRDNVYGTGITCTSTETKSGPDIGSWISDHREGIGTIVAGFVTIGGVMAFSSFFDKKSK